MDNITDLQLVEQRLKKSFNDGKPGPGRPKVIKTTIETQVANLLKKNAKLARVIERDEGFGDMTMAERLQATAGVFDRQIQHAALIVATTSLEDITTDPLQVALRDEQIKYLKSFVWLREKITLLSERVSEEQKHVPTSSEAFDDATELLNDANKTLRLKGVVVDGE